MKKLLLLISILFCFQFQSKASHIFGGEISWECLSNGKYVFYMSFYRECTGIPVYPGIWKVRIFGNPLPRNSQGNAFLEFPLYLDTATYFNGNGQEITPNCADTSFQLKCSTNSDYGSIAKFNMISNPIELIGRPPQTGWRFYAYAVCCRPFYENLINTDKYQIIEAIMYPNKNNDSVSVCFDSSPKFIAPLSYLKCRGKDQIVSHLAWDNDLDSLVYRWGETLTSSSSNSVNIIPMAYMNRFRKDNPLPDNTFDLRNNAAKLDPETGSISFKVFNGNSILNYNTSLIADSYKDGVLISSVKRDVQVFMADCPDTTNNAPIIKLNSISNEKVIEIHIEAGGTVVVPFEVFDDDSINRILGFQSVELQLISEQFSNDLINNQNCANPPCATITTAQFQFDSILNKYTSNSDSTIAGNFNWQTSCVHLGGRGNRKSYYFGYQAKDNYCSIPQSNFKILKINVYPSNPKAPVLECVEKIDNIGAQIYWDNIGISQNDFIAWGVFKKDNSSQNFRELIRISNYNTTSYLDTLSSSFNSAYQIKALNVGCNDTAYSLPSESVKVLNVGVSGSGGSLSSSELNANYQWYDCQADTIVTGETERIFVPKDTGVFAVILTKGVCVDTSNCIAVFPVGLDQIRLKEKLNLFPNPTNGLLNIESQVGEELELKIFNIQGQLVQEQTLVNANNQIQIKGDRGLYFLSITNQSGEQANFKVVKQ